VRDGVVVKGVRFRDHQVAGDILELARFYREDGADELIFYDITASPDGRTVNRDWITHIARLLDIPFCVAGGIRTVADAEGVLDAGADKISINSPALERPALIEELARRFGTQCVVVGVDSLRSGRDAPYIVQQYSGDPRRTRPTGRLTLNWVREVQARGAGEIVLNCIDSDGGSGGYDLDHLAEVRKLTVVPLVASGGAGELGHFTEVFLKTRVDAALAASAFHSGRIRIPDLKRALETSGIPVRRPA
jgi:cyclase